MLLSCVYGLTTGCHHAGIAPAGWVDSPYDFAQESGPASGPESDATLNGYGRPSGRLQVFTCYGAILSNHTALRLETPGKPTLMWDPGGTYKLDDPDYARKYDVLTRNAPSIEQWWFYRGQQCNEPTMHMYEWLIDEDQAKRLHTILLTRHDPLDETQIFMPDAGGLACCKRVSEFLSRFADGKPDIKEYYFWPHKLGDHLWTQAPHRVVIFRKHGPITAYQRPPRSFGSPPMD